MPIYFRDFVGIYISEQKKEFLLRGCKFIGVRRLKISSAKDRSGERKGDKMEIKKCVKESFSVIGKEGSTKNGTGFIQKLWKDANSHFNEVAHLAKKDENGNMSGIWGAMSDFSRSFKPWENHFTEGLYLAGVEVAEEAEPPSGWVKWTIPGYEYLYVKCTEENIFMKVLEYMEEQGIELAGAVHDFNCPKEKGQGYMFFPIRRL